MEFNLKAKARSETGKGPARRARRQGRVPAILYGAAVDATPLEVQTKDVLAALHTEAGHNVLISLQLDGDKHLTMLREIQRDPIRGDLIHVDFVNVARDVLITATVPIHVVGDSRGVKEGGAVEHHLWELTVEALPTEVPPHIEVDISDLGIGDHVRVSQVKAPEGATIMTNPEELIVAVVEPQLIQLPEEVPAEAAEELTPEEAAAAAAEGGEGAAAPEEETS